MTLPWPDLTEEQWRAHARDLRKKNDAREGTRALYSEDQLRDEGGKFASGGGTVYHGSNVPGLQKLDSGGSFQWFTSEKKLASDYAKKKNEILGGKATIYSAKLGLKNPLLLSGDMNDRITANEFRKETGIDFPEIIYAGESSEFVDGYEQKWGRYQLATNHRFAEEIRKRGHDGVVVREQGHWTVGVLGTVKMKGKGRALGALGSRYRRPGFDVLENGDIVGALKGRAPGGDGSGGDS